jgi:hypothetical protein
MCFVLRGPKRRRRDHRIAHGIAVGNGSKERESAVGAAQILKKTLAPRSST